jgi:hypothetical protein
MDDGYSWGEMWWSDRDFITRFNAEMERYAGEGDYTPYAEATLGVIEDSGDEEMTPEEWAEAEIDAWRDSC